MNYEETLKELENIIEKMEASDIKLDEMMKNYKKALDLYKQLQNYLNEYKREIKLVTENGLVDFDEEDNAEQIQ
ncbi:exodeoxyribonuclease VII small subunit [Neofamilia massiliensis]|uniref:exodeoxyribonuclease VII small subunit n=1 Tax=Neofamilia massiliensis TaxID=1673724 RepID=UPI0006BB8A9F|nr:exodeoxyribonuclease VII small subunit [Neofamilia massiliensis]